MFVMLVPVEPEAGTGVADPATLDSAITAIEGVETLLGGGP